MPAPQKQNPGRCRGSVRSIGLLLVQSSPRKAQTCYAKAQPLVSVKVDAPPKVDGKGEDDVWGKSRSVEVEAEDGPEINVKTVHTNDKIYFLLSWQDHTESINLDKWVFDGSKWGVKQEIRWEDEPPWEADSDHFCFQWPLKDEVLVKKFSKKGCAVFCHKPERENKRINAAHKWDELGTGGSKPARNKEGKGPKWIPKDSPNSPFLIKGQETPIDMSKIKKGDAIPGWLLARPNGSRGDITAAAKYDKGKGQWTLELSRKLVTRDPEHDVQFSDLSKTYYFGIAVWENDRLYGHTRVKKPIALKFK